MFALCLMVYAEEYGSLRDSCMKQVIHLTLGGTIYSSCKVWLTCCLWSSTHDGTVLNESTPRSKSAIATVCGMHHAVSNPRRSYPATPEKRSCVSKHLTPGEHVRHNTKHGITFLNPPFPFTPYAHTVCTPSTQMKMNQNASSFFTTDAEP